MTALASSLNELESLVNREASLIKSECRDAVAKGVPQTVAEGLAQAALDQLWAWEKYLRQRIGNAHCTGLPPGPVDPEPQGKPFPRTLPVMLGDFAAGQSLVDALGEAISDLTLAIIIRQLLSLPALDMEVRQREVVKAAADRLPRPLVPDPGDQGDQGDQGGTATTEKKKTRLAPGRK